MSRTSRLEEITGGGLMMLIVLVCCVIFYVVIAGGLGALINPYTINTWLVYCDKPPNVEWWHGGLIGLVASPLTIPAGVITWVCMLFLV